MKNYSSKIRSLLTGGVRAIIITSVLLGFVSCSHGKTDTDNQSSKAEVTTICTTVSMTSTETTSTTFSTTTSTSMTTTAATTSATATETIAWENTVQTKPEPTTAWVEPNPLQQASTDLPISDYERTLLCNVVAREYGSDCVSVYDKACVVATVMNRVNSPQFPDTIEGVLTQPYQFSGYYACDYEWSNVTDSVRESVDYYFNHQGEFGNYLYFYGDGTRNYFY